MSAIIDLIGNTPLARVRIFDKEYPKARVYAKCEYLNPGGSLKDRPVKKIFQNAIESGSMTKDKILLDSSSGNAGIAYAMIGASLGYQVELVIPGNASKERIQRIEAHGAIVFKTDPLEGYDKAIEVAQEKAKLDPAKYFYANQYSNINNWQAHYESTAEEILKQCADLTHLVVGIGTGGTLTGISRKFDDKKAHVHITAIKPELFPGIEGLKPLDASNDYRPEILDDSFVNKRVLVKSEEAQKMCYRLAQAGFFVGHSSGAYMHGVGEVLKQEPTATVVTIFNDLGERYLSTQLWHKNTS